MLNELYTFAEPVQVVPFSSLKWGKFTLLHTPARVLADFSRVLLTFGGFARLFSDFPRDD